VYDVQPKQEGNVSKELVVHEPGRLVVVEVRSLSGESLIKTGFQCSDRVALVKDTILKLKGVQPWQQMLSFEGEMLKDQSSLGELNLLEGAVFDLVIKSGPSLEEIEALAGVAREVLAAGVQGIESLRKCDILEVRAFSKPPPECETVCLAALHVLAIPIKKNASPKNADWSGCKVMLGSVDFRKDLMDLPLWIDQGRVMSDRMVRCRRLIGDLEGDSDSDKIQAMGRKSLMCKELLTFLIGVIKYYDSVAEFRQRFGGATIVELKSHL
jgi:hypothetical protein